MSVSRISDYVLSNELVSMALAMVAEDKQINRVLEELFAEEVLVFPYILSACFNTVIAHVLTFQVSDKAELNDKHILVKLFVYI